MQVWKWFNDNGTALGILIALIPLVWAAVSYLSQKKKKLRHQRFKVYHRLVDELVRGKQDVPFVDNQMAEVFELRRFPEYYDVTRRILQHLRTTWSQNSKAEPVIKELDLTIAYIDKKIGKAKP